MSVDELSGERPRQRVVLRRDLGLHRRNELGDVRQRRAAALSTTAGASASPAVRRRRTEASETSPADDAAERRVGSALTCLRPAAASSRRSIGDTWTSPPMRPSGHFTVTRETAADVPRPNKHARVVRRRVTAVRPHPAPQRGAIGAREPDPGAEHVARVPRRRPGAAQPSAAGCRCC